MRSAPLEPFPEGSAAALLHFGNEASREGPRSRIKTTQPKKKNDNIDIELKNEREGKRK